MSQAPYALRDARFGTKLGLDLKVSFPLNTSSKMHFQMVVFICSFTTLQVYTVFFLNVITILKLIFQVVQVINVEK